LQVTSLALSGLRLVTVKRHGDARGWFAETFRDDVLTKAGVSGPWVQENQSFSAAKGTVRGLHFQLAPFAQAKLVRVLQGSILDVVVDIRRSSPTFGRHVAVRLDAETGAQLFVPEGYAHGFCTLEPDTMLSYKVSAYYSAAHDRGLRWDDPALAIDWPVVAENAIVSDKDKSAPALSHLELAFN
jgi:dTDP-4-dehydrorhamnose 3,5-epimerase